MATTDIFEILAQMPGANITLHNVLLVDVQADANGFDALVVEYQGETRTVAGGGRWNAEWSPREVGRVGCLVPAKSSYGIEQPSGACYFRAYIEPSLRRAPELDLFDAFPNEPGYRSAEVGWRCDRRPGGFRAPPGIIPGKDGGFALDLTESITLRIPPEFIRECRSVQLSPESVLRGFIGDLAGIQNYVHHPRADGYGSNGSDERDYAEAWFNRAYGMSRVDLDALDAKDEAQQERQDSYDELAGFLDDFLDRGGRTEDFLSAMQVIVDKQADAATE